MKKVFLFIFFSYWIFFFLFPPFQNPDEQAHFEVVYWVSRFIYPTVPISPIKNPRPGVDEQSYFANVVQHVTIIPNFTKIKSSPLQKRTDYPSYEKKQFVPLSGQAYNPPLYYIVGALFFGIAKGFSLSLLTQAYFVRVASGLFYFFTVIFAYKALKLLYKEEKIYSGILLFFALNPLLIQSGIGISPDIAVACFCVWFLFLVIKYEKKMVQTKYLIILGIVTAAASLSKITGLILIPSFFFYLYFQLQNSLKRFRAFFIFLIPIIVTQIPWLTLNIIRYHVPVITTPALGVPLPHGLYVSPFIAFVSSIWGYRHIFMHFSGFLGWNEAFPFSPIDIIYAGVFIVASIVGVAFLWKKNTPINKFLVLQAFFLFLFFLSIDVLRKIHSHQGWEIGGRNTLPIFLPIVIFVVQGIAFFLRRKVSQIANYLFYFAIFYYYFILIFVLIPRYYV